MSRTMRRALLLLLCMILCMAFAPAACAQDGEAAAPVSVCFVCDDTRALSGLHVFDGTGTERAPDTDDATGSVKYGRYSLLPGNYSVRFHDERGEYEDMEGSLAVDEALFRIIPIELTPHIDVHSYSFGEINPLYIDVVTEDEIPEPAISEEELRAELLRLRTMSGSRRRNTVFYGDSGVVHQSVESAGAELRAQLVSRDESPIMRLYAAGNVTTSEPLFELARGIFHAAVAHTGVPSEGDKLLWEYASYNFSISVSYDPNTDRTLCVFSYTFVYYTTAAQEAELNSVADSILAGLALDGKSDYQKIQAIYNYLCSHVTYDRANLNNDAYKLKFTDYAALVNGTAVCQGYSVAFYRLCLSVGVDTRIVTSRNMKHAWNIAGLGGQYYELDSTWDANYTPATYRYFLKGSSDWLSNHKYNGISEIGDEFNDSAFAAACPLPDYNFSDVLGIPVDSSPASLKNAVLDLEAILSEQAGQMPNGAGDIERFLVSVVPTEAQSADGSLSYDVAVCVSAYRSGSVVAQTQVEQSRLVSGTVFSFSLDVPAAWAGRQIAYTRSGGGFADDTGTLTAAAGTPSSVAFSAFPRLGRFVLTPVKYTLSFDSLGGSAVAAQTVVNGDAPSRPADPVKSGLWFVGWYRDNAFQNAFSFTDAMTASITVYARWVAPDLVLPAALTEIGEDAFSGVFTFVKLPERAVSIAARAFADCPQLSFIYIPEDTVSINATAFGDRKPTIFGVSPSAAETFASDHGCAFIPVAAAQ